MSNRMTAANLRAFRAADGDNTAKRSYTDREGPIHKAILELLDLKLPPFSIYHHSPNELDMRGPEAARQIAKARNLGTRKGWPDIEIIWQGQAFFIEVKAGNGPLSADQVACHQELMEAGAEVALVRSVDDAETALRVWGMT